MADIIRLSGDRHQETLELLPWYATGSIDSADRVKVEAHLADCAICRAELEAERKLGDGVAALPLDVGSSFAEFRRRLEPLAAPAPRRSARIGSAVRGVAGRPGRKSWLVVAQAAAILLVVGIAAPGLQRRGPAPVQYRTLGSAPTHPAGNLLVMFRPDISEATLRALLTQSGGRVVDGPTATGAYILDVPMDRRGEVLKQLRGKSTVTLAQPIDPDPQS